MTWARQFELSLPMDSARRGKLIGFRLQRRSCVVKTLGLSHRQASRGTSACQDVAKRETKDTLQRYGGYSASSETILVV